MGANWTWSYQKGREKRLAAELNARINNHPFNPDDIPLHSHCGTMQNKFAKGWASVTPAEIQRHVAPQSYRKVRDRLRTVLA